MRVGQAAPELEIDAVDASLQQFPVRIGGTTAQWLALLFYPRDHSFVCPTELIAFSARHDEFAQRNCRLLGVSVDSIASHRDWLSQPPEAGGIGPLRFPLASDPDGTAAQLFNSWDE